jgi:hypothetical protein
MAILHNAVADGLQRAVALRESGREALDGKRLCLQGVLEDNPRDTLVHITRNQIKNANYPCRLEEGLKLLSTK